MAVTISAGGASSVRSPLKRIARPVLGLAKVEAGGVIGPPRTTIPAVKPVTPIKSLAPIILATSITLTRDLFVDSLWTWGSLPPGGIRPPAHGPLEAGGVVGPRFLVGATSVWAPIEDRDVLGVGIGPSKLVVAIAGGVQRAEVVPAPAGTLPPASRAPPPLDPGRQNS